MLRIYEIKLKIGESEDDLESIVAMRLSRYLHDLKFKSFRISGKSIDARDKKNIKFIYNVDIEILPENSITDEKFISLVQKRNRKIKIKKLPESDYSPISTFNGVEQAATQTTAQVTVHHTAEKEDTNSSSNSSPGSGARPVIAGFGPAGMFAGLFLAHNGFSPIIIERGKPVEERVKDVRLFWDEGIFDPDSNPLFGEGGAGTFSDGKLTTGKNDKRIEYILREFVKAGAPDEILYMKNPHIGTDVLRRVVKNIREKIISLGGEIRFGNKLTAINSENGSLKSITVKTPDTSEEILTKTLVLATGHSARDTYKALLDQGLHMEQKPFSIGLRIEHEQALIDRSQYGYDFEKIYEMNMTEAGLPPAEYKLSHRLADGRGAYTFCMCPGGEIIITSAEEETVSVNGMSEQARNGKKANSALLVDVRTSDYGSDRPLAGIDFQREYEGRAFVAGGKNYGVPTETVADFMSADSKLAFCLPEFAAEGIREAIPVFGRKIKGFDDGDTLLKGIESSSSSPVRIPRNSELLSNIVGIYPCGEGAGYAGGITSAAIDGLRCGEMLVENSRNLFSNL